MQVLLINDEIIRLDLVVRVVALMNDVRFYLLCGTDYAVVDVPFPKDKSPLFVNALAQLMADGKSGEYVEDAGHIKRIGGE